MPRKALIVEDEEGVAALLGELCRGAGLAVARARGGGEAMAMLAQELPALVVLDLVLAESDGFKVAAHLRSLPGGDAVPLFVVSGVYKKPPEGFEARVNARFRPKPFDAAALAEDIRAALGESDRAAGVRRGSFGDAPPGALFARLCEERATGLLEIVAAEVRRRLWWQGGQVRFAQSNVKAESAGAMQVNAGRLEAAAFDRAVAHARQARVPLHEALVAAGALSAADLGEALRQQTVEVAVHALEMLGADWTLVAADPEKQPDARQNPLALLAEHARRHGAPDEAKAALARLPDGPVERSPLLERELFAVRSAWPGEATTTLAAQRLLLSDLVAKLPAAELPFAWALAQSGLLAVKGRAAAGAPGALAGEEAAAAAEDADRGRKFTADEAKARKFIFEEQRRTAGLDHYAMLGLSRGAGIEECRRAFLDRARAYHADAYSGLELGGARPVLLSLFQRLNEAAEVLSDEQKRAEYDIYLERKAKGLPTDVAAILRAEEAFTRGQAALRAGRLGEAVDSFREAVQLNHAEPEHHAWLGLALFKAKGAPAAAEARHHLERALEDAPDLACAHHFLGIVARDTGSEDDALMSFAKAAKDPNYEPVKRDLAALQQRRARPGTRSLLSRLLGR